MTSHEQFCLDTAVKFKAVRGRRPATRLREEFSSIDEAIAFGEGFGDGKTMIYAVNAQGNAAHIRNA